MGGEPRIKCYGESSKTFFKNGESMLQSPLRRRTGDQNLEDTLVAGMSASHVYCLPGHRYLIGPVPPHLGMMIMHRAILSHLLQNNSIYLRTP